ncbi:HlyD family secretion protein [Pandoraea terrae]|uniref:HlyD family secretion protein n=1 Tax=Pandoraea terrae TaxID=1537710 RepID=UPI00177FF2B3|nr:HlyD family efflux transporter periplasmic adaptor subunit [Pandoraea terrae]
MKFATAFSVAASGVLLGIFVMGSYTQRSSVVGHLVPRSGIAKLSSPSPGTVKEMLVTDGQAVKGGDVLLIVSGERRDSNGNATLATVSQQISTRRDQLAQDLQSMEKGHGIQVSQLQNRVTSQSREIAKLDELIADHRQLVTLARASANRYRQLHVLDAASKEQAQQAKAQFLERQSRLHTLERDRLIASRELADAESALASLPHKYQTERSQLERQLVTLSQALAENEVAREFSVIAPVDGTATAVVTHLGQRVIENKHLVSIIPIDQPLEAHLYVQSEAVGLLKPEIPVTLRYRAFPYQKFGLQKGRILSISETSAPPDEITDIAPYHGLANEHGPLFLVKVRLDRQWVSGVHGEVLRLRAGMLLDANIARETRRLHEWAFAPLYRIRDKL